MTIIADRGLFIRILTASGKVGQSEAESYADALDGATKDPATKADLAEVRAEIALLRQEIKSLDRRTDEKFDAQTNKLLVRLGGMMIAGFGLVLAALRYTAH